MTDKSGHIKKTDGCTLFSKEHAIGDKRGFMGDFMQNCWKCAAQSAVD
ncbi:hypothetical protein LG204_07800 [Methylovorus menthalis]|nr:hypothetical protein [Methylovorus menthalis]MCB4811215.1 hypothetical protein [Methylovorus menthalis]